MGYFAFNFANLPRRVMYSDIFTLLANVAAAFWNK